MGDFKDILTDIVTEGQDGHNNIADQLLKDERIAYSDAGDAGDTRL